MQLRKRIFDIVEKAGESDRVSHIYDMFMILVIAVSLVPLALKDPSHGWVMAEWCATAIFVLDYLLRWMTADFKLQKGKSSFFLYPFSAMAIVDILSILPTLLTVNQALRVFKAFRLIRALRVLKIFKGFRYSKNIEIIAVVFKRQKRSLIAVGGLAVGYIFLSALVVFNVEPETFHSFFDAVYWATVSLTTVGYGDIYTVSVTGRVITMISAMLGIAIVALPAGIITAGYMTEIQREEESETKQNESEEVENDGKNA
jgi:voltage-gated potassium channel